MGSWLKKKDAEKGEEKNDQLTYNSDGFPELVDLTATLPWEREVFAVGEKAARSCEIERMKSLFLHVRQYFEVLPKARTARVIRTLIDFCSAIPDDGSDFAVVLCKEYIEWCHVEKRTFLRQRIHIRLIQLYLQKNAIEEGINSVNQLLPEMRKLDDKLALVDIFLLEAKLHFKMQNTAKARSVITTCKNNANAVHCPPLTQASIDLICGKIHCQEHDYSTAYSYFLEALEAFNANASQQLNIVDITIEANAFAARKQGNAKEIDNPKLLPTDGKIDSALLAFKYLLLAKILVGEPEEVPKLIENKRGSAFADHIEVIALRKVAKAYEERSLKMFDAADEEYKFVFKADEFVKDHVHELYNRLFEKNLLKVLEPFSKVDLPYIANIFEISVDKIQSLIAEMILEKKIHGIIDQAEGTLILHEPQADCSLHKNVVDCICNYQAVIHTIQHKACSL